MTFAAKLGQTWRALAALALAAPLLAGCVNCFDDGELEAAYRAGEALAVERNDAEYGRGYDEASRLTYADGEYDGGLDGYEDGYFDGYYGPGGYPSGYDIGYLEGHNLGSIDPAACTNGANDGWIDGDREGYAIGWDDGYGQGWDDGYADGWSDGAASCGFRAASVDARDLEYCEQRGYDYALDRTAHDRGYEAGKRDNLDYQAGYLAEYELAYVTGFDHGERDGFDDGSFDGFNDGHAAGYDVAYYACYDQAWPDGWDAGYGEGWAESIGVGYDEGYAAGFQDASGEC